MSDPSPSKKRKERSWDDSYALLRAHHEQHGNCLVGGDESIQSWMSEMRQKRQKLSPRQIELLNGLNFGWTTQEVQAEEQWESMLSNLCNFKERNGHANVPCSYQEDPKLGRWVRSQRKVFQDGRLREDHKAKLDKIGFAWRLRKSNGPRQPKRTWDDQFKRLVQFKKEYGHVKVPLTGTHSENTRLNRWLSSQRQSFRLGKLSQEKKERLERIGISLQPVSAEKPKSRRQNHQHQAIKRTTDKNQQDKISVHPPSVSVKDPNNQKQHGLLAGNLQGNKAIPSSSTDPPINPDDVHSGGSASPESIHGDTAAAVPDESDTEREIGWRGIARYFGDKLHQGLSAIGLSWRTAGEERKAPDGSDAARQRCSPADDDDDDVMTN